MPFSALDTAGVARAVAEIAEQPDDLAEAFFERREEVEWRPEDETVAARVRREEGLAVRLVRGPRAWLAHRDGLSGRVLAEAVRQVARSQPRGLLAEPVIEPGSPPEARFEPLAALAAAIERALRAEHVAFPLRLSLRRVRREIQVVGPRLVPALESERYVAIEAEMPWGVHGDLVPDDGEEALAEGLEGLATRIAATLAERFRCRAAASPAPFTGVVLLGPGAAAVLLHEAVAHFLEADTLGEAGDPAAAIGQVLGPDWLDVLDDPGGAPPGVRRSTDDEGLPVLRRWLVRAGRVEQPIADAVWARRCPHLLPGAARRADRQQAPGPRSSFLEVTGALPSPVADLRRDAEGGLWLPLARRGGLDPANGRFTLEAPCARRIRDGEIAEPVGPCRLEGTVPDLLAALVAMGDDATTGGAGWCAKGGARLPVWARSPTLRCEGLRVLAP